ncbi:hypothetical protein OA93_06020 [Flavobacterium sp. KMS]|uniref:hypothetical protein n=1 Tax=Flavobacterium sp. KMS TaxID=1566023 RepID=UPI00057ED40F|nr:hypothetical protein [Flavobacterium sp. KMS]KIA99185.1 hypothetical protein OA93_06020 [Flavobacterium sp. KMS]
MKRSLTFFAILLFCNSSIAQQLVHSTSQVYLLEQNKERFINKPLKDLLKVIKPEIKTAHVFNSDNSSLFGFRFTTLAQQRKREGTIDDRVTLLVYVKEFIEWDWEEKPKGNEILWTQKDAEKYGDLIVTYIGVVPTSEK